MKMKVQSGLQRGDVCGDPSKLNEDAIKQLQQLNGLLGFIDNNRQSGPWVMSVTAVAAPVNERIKSSASFRLLLNFSRRSEVWCQEVIWCWGVI